MMVWSGNGTMTMDDDGKNTRGEERLMRKRRCNRQRTNNESGFFKMMTMWTKKKVGPTITIIFIATPKLMHGR